MSEPPATADSAESTAPAPPASTRAVAVIEPRSGWQAVNLEELWRYRELLYFLVWRDVKIRYKQTVLGVTWAVLQPLMTMIVFTLFFGKLGGMEQTSSVPYPVLVFSALLPWTFFANAVSQGGNSLVNSAHLISKVYFPRLLIPLSSLGAPLLDLAISFVVLAGLLGWYAMEPPVPPTDQVAVTPADGGADSEQDVAEPKQIVISGQILLLPVFLVLTILTAFAVGSLLSALTIAYRDFRYVLTFLIQTWMFVTPVAYSLEIVPAAWRLAYAANPMVGAIVGFRRSITGEAIPWEIVGISALSSLVFLFCGVMYFRRIERRFADII